MTIQQSIKDLNYFKDNIYSKYFQVDDIYKGMLFGVEVFYLVKGGLLKDVIDPNNVHTATSKEIDPQQPTQRIALPDEFDNSTSWVS